MADKQNIDAPVGDKPCVLLGTGVKACAKSS